MKTVCVLALIFIMAEFTVIFSIVSGKAALRVIGGIKKKIKF